MSLPNGWREVHFYPALGQVVRGVTFGREESSDLPFPNSMPVLRAGNIQDRLITDRDLVWIPEDRVSADQVLRRGDVVVCTSSGSAHLVGKSALLDHDFLGTYGAFNAVMRCDQERLVPEYLQLWLRSPLFDQWRSRLIAGANIQNIRHSDLAGLKIILPPLPEQQRIADVISQLRAVTQLESISADRLRRLGREQFLSLFGHPARNPQSFETIPLGSLGSLDRGVSKHRPRDAEHLLGGPYPFIQTGDVARAGDWITSYERTYSEAGLAQSRLWPRGTLCITIAANIGKTAILDFDACFPDSIVGFQPNERVLSEYIVYCLRFFQEALEQRAPKSAQMNINLDTLRNLRVPLPPWELQNEFRAFLHELRTLDTLIETRRATLDKLTQASTADALSGRLTATWREQHADELATAVRVLDESLGATAARAVQQITEDTASGRAIGIGRPRRQALVDQLSGFQNEVWNTLRHEWRGAVLADDPAVFEAFCISPQTAWRLEGFAAGREEVRRALEQLAAMGLIRKMSLPRANPATGDTDYLTAFRPFRESPDGGRVEEDSALTDAARLAQVLDRRAQER